MGRGLFNVGLFNVEQAAAQRQRRRHLFYEDWGRVTTALNRSPSTASSKVPP